MALHDMNIIEIERDDIHRIEPLWKELNALHGDLSPHFKDHFASFTFEQRIENLMTKECLIIFAAQVGEEIIGYCIATKSGSAGEIDSLFIKDQHRSMGLGISLTERALSWLKSLSCETINILVAEGNESVVSFYRQFGFKERAHVLQLQKP